MAGVCTSLMAEWKSLTQHEMGWYVPAGGIEGCALSAAVLEGEVECLLALHQLSSRAVAVGFPLSAVLWDLFGSDMSHLVACH